MYFLKTSKKIKIDNDKFAQILQFILAQFYVKNCTIDPVGSSVEIWLVFSIYDSADKHTILVL